jgi:hypothetical protein
MTDADLPSDEELVAVANRAYREVASAGANVSGASRAGRLAIARLAQQRERERHAAEVRELRAAAEARLGSGHNDTCDSQLVEDMPCSCGHDRLRAALSTKAGGAAVT